MPASKGSIQVTHILLGDREQGQGMYTCFYQVCDCYAVVMVCIQVCGYHICTHPGICSSGPQPKQPRTDCGVSLCWLRGGRCTIVSVKQELKSVGCQFQESQSQWVLTPHVGGCMSSRTFLSISPSVPQVGGDWPRGSYRTQSFPCSSPGATVSGRWLSCFSVSGVCAQESP